MAVCLVFDSEAIIMIEEAAELDNYLPLSFKSEQEYITFLWNTFETIRELHQSLITEYRIEDENGLS